jgi:hypothetical protein
MTSRIPAATDALVVALTASIGAATNVVDGPPLSWDNIQLPMGAVSEDRFLFVGARPGEDAGADSDQDFNAAGAVSMDEKFTIWCTAFVWGGDLVMKTRRDDAFGIVAAADQAIRADPSLAGAVLYSRMAGVSSVAPRQSEDGSDCTVVFAVTCRAYLT